MGGVRVQRIGSREVLVRPFAPVSDHRRESAAESVMVSRSGGTAPRWSADGKELFFITREGAIASAPVSVDPALGSARRRPCSERLVSRHTGALPGLRWGPLPRPRAGGPCSRRRPFRSFSTGKGFSAARCLGTDPAPTSQLGAAQYALGRPDASFFLVGQDLFLHM